MESLTATQIVRPQNAVCMEGGRRIKIKDELQCRLYITLKHMALAKCDDFTFTVDHFEEYGVLCVCGIFL